MKEYQLIATGEVVPFNVFVAMHPQVSFPRDAQGRYALSSEEVASLGAIEVLPTAPPVVPATKRAVRAGVEDIEGLPYEKWVVEDRSTTEKVDIFKAAIQQHMEVAAVAQHYYSLDSAVSYAALPLGEPYQDEGMAFLVWRARVWKECYVILDKVLTGQIPEPTMSELIAMLPQLVLPS